MTWPVAGRSGNLSHGPGRPPREWTLIEDLRRCAGWLLWSRRMSSDLGLVPVKELAPVLESLGLSESQVSRVEHGKVDVPLRTIHSYERLLELPYGELQAPLLSLSRVVDDDLGRRWLQPSAVPEGRSGAIVDEIFDAEEAGAPITGAQWLRLAHAVATGVCDGVPTRLLFRWVRRLLSELMRGVNNGYFVRLEAASTVAAYDHTAPMVLRAVRELTAVPGVSGAYDAWAVVGDIRNPRLLDQLIEPLQTVPESTFRAFCAALSQPGFDQRLTTEQMRSICSACAARLPTAGHTTVEVVDRLIGWMPRSVTAAVREEIARIRPRTRRSDTSQDDRDLDAELAVYLRFATEAAWPGRPDGQLEALLRVVLLGEQFGQRMHTGSLLWVSPYAAALAEAAVFVASSDDFGAAAHDAAIYVLSRTVTADNEELLRSVLADTRRRDLRSACLMALGHISALRTEDDLRPYLCDSELRWTAIYVAGITHHPQLMSPEAESPDARWWQSVGPGCWE
ncbi:helix-turn-helix domain-containing protein [Flexivirga oryzae]|uniref:Transcriptional regulator with XRE-family HTH domain n=1 Tax=Flexivirga oryzae TaxID=1794944 RepID=A0A839NCX5_9MICO|nr:helix-turn-helix transcriptional regulator [Flexivirga oryzae]MBB2893035.1 transcriptional regulator with XRE-family HTH domain [Flexivirga oryzae]